MKTGLAYVCLLVCIGTGFGCNMNQASVAMTTCYTAFSTALQAGDKCGVWSTYECCLKDSYSAAGCDASQANAMLTATRSSQPALANCAAATCSGSSSGGGSTVISTVGGDAGGTVDSETTPSSGDHVDAETTPNSGSSSCDLTAAQATGHTCVTAMTQGIAGGDVCGAWGIFECCVKDGYSAAGCDTSQANTMLSTTRSMQPTLGECASPTCSGSSEPTEVTTTLMSHVHYPAHFDPTTFDIDAYIDAVKTALGVSAAPDAVLKAWEILVSYVVPAGSDLVALKTAVATANSIEESAIILTTATRRLNQGRRLGTQVDAKINVPDAAKAKEVKTSAASVDALTTALGGAVSVKTGSEPAAAAVIETVVKSDASKATNLQNLIADAGAAVGGTITAEVVPNNSGSGPASETASSVRSSSIMVAAVLLLRMIM